MRSAFLFLLTVLTTHACLATGLFSPKRKCEAAIQLSKTSETRDLRGLNVVNPGKYVEHDLRLGAEEEVLANDSALRMQKDRAQQQPRRTHPPCNAYAPDPARQFIHGFILSEFGVGLALLDASRQIQFAMNLLF